jgi:hypothetical protein
MRLPASPSMAGMRGPRIAVRNSPMRVLICWRKVRVRSTALSTSRVFCAQICAACGSTAAPDGPAGGGVSATDWSGSGTAGGVSASGDAAAVCGWMSWASCSGVR